MLGWCSSLVHTEAESLPASPQVLGYPVKQLERADITEGCLCSWFPSALKLPREQEQGPRSLAPVRVWALCRAGRVQAEAATVVSEAG